MYAISFGKRNILYELIRSNRSKTLGISIQHTTVTVTAPQDTPIKKIEEVLYQKAPWILKQLAEFEEMNHSVRELAFVSGEKLPYLGRHYRLKVTKTAVSAASLHFRNGRFWAEVPDTLNPAQYREALLPLYKVWLQETALRYTKKRILRFTGKLQKEPIKITIKEQEQRWGSCTRSGAILLNWRIFLAPSSIVDYVLAHEVAHLKEMNHTKAYWDTLRMLLPDYEERKEWLRINGASLNL